MASTVHLMTVAEYEKVTAPSGGRYELHHGELVFVTFPRLTDSLVQHRLHALLSARLSDYGFVGIEIAFRPEREHELWAADVAVVSGTRLEESRHKDWLFGAPDLVIEVLSPSNTAAEMNERERMCLRHGCLEFWVVDPKLRIVKVSTPDGSTVTYPEEGRIPLSVFGADSLPVFEIFKR